jgi:hypothetical protein
MTATAWVIPVAVASFAESGWAPDRSRDRIASARAPGTPARRPMRSLLRRGPPLSGELSVATFEGQAA